MMQIPKINDTRWYVEAVANILEHSRQNYAYWEKQISDYLFDIGISKCDFTSKEYVSLFELFITAPYSELVVIKERVQKMMSNSRKDISSRILLTYRYFSKYNINNLIVNKMQVQSCPYCNESYVMNRNPQKTMAQLDHFWNKKDHPLFAICLYNLIPCCYACNHIKLKKDLLVSPYNESYDRTQFKISYMIRTLSSDTSDSIETMFLYNGANDIKHDIELLHIDDLYKNHNNVIWGLLKKREMYSDSSIDELWNQFGDLFDSKEELINSIFSYYIDEKEMLNNPFSKLANDILVELGVKKQ